MSAALVAPEKRSNIVMAPICNNRTGQALSAASIGLR